MRQLSGILLIVYFLIGCSEIEETVPEIQAPIEIPAPVEQPEPVTEEPVIIAFSERLELMVDTLEQTEYHCPS